MNGTSGKRHKWHVLVDDEENDWNTDETKEKLTKNDDEDESSDEDGDESDDGQMEESGKKKNNEEIGFRELIEYENHIRQFSTLNNKNALTTINGNGNSSAAAIVAQIFAEKSYAATAAAINKVFRELFKDPKALDEAANYLYASLLDDTIVGVFIEIHHLNKTGNLSALDGVPEDDQDSSFRIVDMPNFDIFGISTAKKPMDCTCPNCDRPVSAARFAPHLEKCMGMGRISSRIASRRLATKEGSNASSSSSYLQSNANTDDEDDVDWSSEKRRKKTSQNSRNGSKKNNGKSF